MRFGILNKILTAFLTLSLVPLITLSAYTWIKMMDTVQMILTSSKRALTENAMSLLEDRAMAISSQVEQCLLETVKDIHMLETLISNEIVYENFSRVHQKEVWVRENKARRFKEKVYRIPLYKEITYADPSGYIKLCIRDGKKVTSLQNISGPFKSAYGPEDYFNEAKKRYAKDIYVSHLIGMHISKEEQLQGAENIAAAKGITVYNGVIRFAKAIYMDKAFQGVVSLALDHRHLMEFTQHVLPFGDKEGGLPSYQSGNYAFMFDDEGWMITHPKLWDIRGYNKETGILVNPESSHYNKSNLNSGTIPFNLLNVPFIHKNYQSIAIDVQNGRSGVRKTYSVGGVPRVLAYAPIRFNYGDYQKTGYFGGITLGAQTDLFHQSVNRISEKMDLILKEMGVRFILIICSAALLVSAISVLMARGFTRPILKLTQKVKEISEGRYDVDIDIKSGDELERLGHNVKQMGLKLIEHQEHLLQSMNDLADHVKILKKIHGGSQKLTLSCDMEKVYEVILKTCVEGIGFERAVLFTLNEKQKSLICSKTYGFNGDDEPIIKKVTLPFDTGEDFHCQVFESKDTLLIQTMEKALSESSLQKNERELFHSGAKNIAPIKINERIFGILYVDIPSKGKKISENQLEFLKVMANESSMAIERTLLLNEAVKRRDFIERVFSNMLSGLLVFDSRGKVQTANAKAKHFLDLTLDNILNKDMDDLLKPYPELLSLIKKKEIDEKILSLPVMLTVEDGRIIHLEATASSLKTNDENNEYSTILIFRDVTRRKNMEMHLSRSDRLVSLGILAAGVAHEIRNPLTGIALLLDDLHDQMRGSRTEKRMMQKALEEIEKLDTIVTRLLDFSSNPARQMKKWPIHHVIDDMLFLVKKQCAKKGVLLLQKLAEDIPDVNIDPEHIQQALLNIVLNALNVLDKNGQIMISTQYAGKVDLLPQKKVIEIVIKDNGPGINQEDLKYLFDPFFSRTSHGFGLGLSITHTIIDDHGGKIMVKSEKGKGSCFTIYLPVS